MFPNGCRTCFKHKDEAPNLQFCARCRFTRYCGSDCQKVDWDAGHKKVCKHLAALRQQTAARPPSLEPGNVASWRAFWASQGQLLADRLGRPLEMSEHFALAGQRVCGHCYYPALSAKPETSSVEECPDCLMVSFCEQHRPQVLQAHAQACQVMATTRRCATLLLHYQQAHGEPPSCLSPADLSPLEAMPLDWTAYLSQRCFPGDWSEDLMRIHTMQLTWPVTLLYALHHAQAAAGRTLADLPETLTLHLIGAATTELHSDASFEEVLHALPHVKRLQISFVGPELPIDNAVFPSSADAGTLCSSCHGARRSMTFYASQKLYHDYMGSLDGEGKQRSPPDLAFAFNSGLHEHIVQGSCSLANSTWTKTFQLLRDKGVPTYLTAYTTDEIVHDEHILRKLGCHVTMPKHEQPFKCLVPLMDNGGQYQAFWVNNMMVGFCGAEQAHAG
ncbi:hypothetical protein WJX72_004500 [[Myrmecia] bisecta]|uniref:MYND-type domain-containing protein n=1 Tax=[Myrmecia] bisecta TaxID=41462 RepID=A0AAW1PWJ8_9CHLO